VLIGIMTTKSRNVRSKKKLVEKDPKGGLTAASGEEK
jgi:hypothetical protein